MIHAYRGHISTNRRPRKGFPANIKTVGNSIYAKRFEAGLSKKALAAMLGVPKKLIREWESDLKMPTEAEWQKLVAAL
jgi:DNA-binding transcriptional regulator YiaG